MLLIYSEKQSARLSYILDFVFVEYAGIQYELTTDVTYYCSAEGHKINYSSQALCSNEFRLSPASLLFENDLNPPRIGVIEFGGTSALFPTYPASDFSFDVLCACFYMLSRFEEYQPYIKDSHGRFKPDESLASKHDFLGQPVVNIWINAFLAALNKSFGTTWKNSNAYSFTNTIDIDIAWSYKHKGMYRNVYGLLRSLSHGNFAEIAERLKVVAGLQKDPFDTFDFIIDLHKKHNLNTIFFVHVGDYGVYDKNIPYKNNKFRELIRHLADYAEIGIHPSYESSLKPEKVKEEIERLSEIIKKDVTKSRQHFLRITFPYTYRILVDNKIKEDLSLGFASEIGFRAGTCTPFRFFDLDAGKPTSLLIRPFSLMEGTLKDYKNLNLSKSEHYIKHQINIIKENQGEFISLWHNESLSDVNRWEGWRDLYKKMIELALP